MARRIEQYAFFDPGSGQVCLLYEQVKPNNGRHRRVISDPETGKLRLRTSTADRRVSCRFPYCSKRGEYLKGSKIRLYGCKLSKQALERSNERTDCHEPGRCGCKWYLPFKF